MATSIAFVHPWLLTVRSMHAAAEFEPEETLPRADPHRKPRAPSSNLVALDKVLPPGRPACFDTHASWREYVEVAAVAGRRSTSKWRGDGPVIWIQGAPALNRDFSYCEDCTAARQARMQSENRCLPDFLKGRET